MLRATKKLLVLPALAFALVVSGCTSPSDNANSGAGTASESRLATILESKEIKIAVPDQAPPWGVKSASGEYEGYDIDLANALAESLGAEVEFVPGTSDARIPNLQTDKADALIFSFSALNDRAQLVDMSIPYAAVGTVFAVPVDSPIKSYADLAGKTISSNRGSSGQTLVETQFPDSELTLFSSQADSIQALKSRKVDALIEINTIVDAVVADDPSLRVLEGPPLAPARIVIGVKQGDQTWLNYINNFLRNWNASGANEAASQKWMKAPMTVPEL